MYNFIMEEVRRDRQLLAFLLSGGKVDYEGGIYGIVNQEIKLFNKLGEVIA